MGLQNILRTITTLRHLLVVWMVGCVLFPASITLAQPLPGLIRDMATDSTDLVIGIDVSSHQGAIDWEQAGQQKVKFAYIKATEGKVLVDKKFEDNYNGSRQAGIVTGAYHFFLFRLSGREQADHFIKNASFSPGDLPPAVDIEIFSNQYLNLSDRVIASGIQVYINMIYNHYGVWPVIYTDNITYRRFIKGRFLECPLWICDLKKEPQLDDNRSWLIWQFSHTGRIKGISGNVDMNVLRGSMEYLTALIERTAPK